MNCCYKSCKTEYVEIDHTCINYNSAELYFFIHVMFAYDDEYNLFCKYWLSIRDKPLKKFFSVLCLQLANILTYKSQDETYYQLPDAFCREPWRGQKLILEIMKKRLNTKSKIIAEIYSWETEIADYL